MVLIEADPLRTFTRQVFESCGAPAAEAAIVADHLISANLLGYDTHGVIRIPQYVEDVRSGMIRPGAHVEVEKETQTTALLDCGWNFGQVGGLRAIQAAVVKARHAHTATVVAKRANHAGRLGAFTAKAAEEGFIAIGFCNSPRHGHFVLPWGGCQGRLATNPVSYAIPCDSRDPIVADFSTAMTAEGFIRLNRNRGQALPAGLIVDSHGRPSADPNDFYGPPQGAILPFGGDKGYRGYALSLLVEILGGLLAGSSTVQDQPGNGLAFIVVDVGAFLPPAVFAALVREMGDYVKSSPPAPGHDGVLLPGEPDFRRHRERLRKGIPIDETTWEQIQGAARSLGVEWKASLMRA